MEIHKGDILYFDSDDGSTFTVKIISINDFRPPESKYAVDVINSYGTSYYDFYDDYYFCGQDFIDKCYKTKKEKFENE